MDPISEDIFQNLLEKRSAELTQGQEVAMDLFARFFQDKGERATFMLKGAAGTGKTFLIDLISGYLAAQGYKIALLAPTGRAAKVLNRRVRKYASTIHRHIYSTTESGFGGFSFHLKDNRDNDKLIYVVDEASMVGEGQEQGRSLLADLLMYVFGEDPYRKLILVGDHAQLPPVGSKSSPGLDEDHLHQEYGLRVFAADLNEVMRQAFDSDILRLSETIRLAMEEEKVPEVQQDLGPEVEVLENTYAAIEYYTGFFDPDDMDNAVMISYSNHLATRLNQAVRHELFGEVSHLVADERIMVVRNNYAWGNKEFPFIANGEMGIVREVLYDTYEERYGMKWMDVVIEFQAGPEKSIELECKVMLDLLDSKKPQVDYATMQKVFQARRSEFDELPKTKRMKNIRKDPYLNALQIKYGYAITGHKSQGGQWKYVMVCFEPMYKGMQIKEYLRWCYTALTRAEERLYLDRFPFFGH